MLAQSTFTSAILIGPAARQDHTYRAWAQDWQLVVTSYTRATNNHAGSPQIPLLYERVPRPPPRASAAGRARCIAYGTVPRKRYRVVYS